MALFDFLSFGKDKSSQKDPVETTINRIIIQESARGSSGSEVFAGYYNEEYLASLLGTQRADCFDKMRRSDAQVKMLLSAVKNPIRTASRDVNAASDDQDHVNHAALCEKILFEDLKFDKFLTEALTMVEFGHAVFEKVHKVHLDKSVENDDGVEFLSSYIGFKKLGWRSPKTIETWNFNEEKDLESIRQCSDGDLGVDAIIPAKHLILMAIDMEGDDYEGISMIRSCYGNYFRKNEYLKLNAIGIEKSLPLPTAEIPVGQEESQQYANLIATLEAFTSHQKNYLTYPVGWNVQLSTTTGYDPSKVETSIDSEDRRMAKAFIANFLELGMGGGGGAFALSNDLSDFFLSGLVYISNIIKSEINDLLKEIVILNFGKQSKYPTFEFSGIADKAGEEFAKIMDLLVKARVIIPDDDLEKHTRKRLGLTPKSDNGQRDINPQPEIVEDPELDEISLSEKISNAIFKKRKAME